MQDSKRLGRRETSDSSRRHSLTRVRGDSLDTNPSLMRDPMDGSVISSPSLPDESVEARPHEHAKGQNRLHHRTGD